MAELQVRGTCALTHIHNSLNMNKTIKRCKVLWLWLISASLEWVYLFFPWWLFFSEVAKDELSQLPKE